LFCRLRTVAAGNPKCVDPTSGCDASKPSGVGKISLSENDQLYPCPRQVEWAAARDRGATAYRNKVVMLQRRLHAERAIDEQDSVRRVVFSAHAPSRPSVSRPALRGAEARMRSADSDTEVGGNRGRIFGAAANARRSPPRWQTFDTR